MPPVGSPAPSRTMATMPGQPRLAVVIGQVCMEQQVGRSRILQPAALQVRLGDSPGERLTAVEDAGDFARVVPLLRAGRRDAGEATADPAAPAEPPPRTAPGPTARRVVHRSIGPADSPVA